jgi:hypothetical protein
MPAAFLTRGNKVDFERKTRIATPGRLAGAAALHALILALLLAAMFPGVFFRGEILSPSDLLFAIPPWDKHAPAGVQPLRHKLMSDVLAAFTPYYALCKQSVEQGEWPLWNPREFAGMPLMANAQSTVVYPPRLVMAGRDLARGITWFVMLKLWLCGMTAWCCARGLRLGPPAALFFSLAWMLASYNLVWAMWSLTDVSAWVPVLFLGVEWILTGRYRRGIAAAVPGAALLLLAGHPETAFSMSLGMGVYFALRLAWNARNALPVWRPVAACAVVWTLALAVSAVLVFPLVEYLLNSSTFFDRTNAHRLPLSPSAAASFWAPRFLGTWQRGNFWGNYNSNLQMMLYSGMAVWVAAPLLFTRRGEGKDRGRGWTPQTVCLALAGLCGMLTAFAMPPFDKALELPVLSSMLICYHSVFALFALPLLAATGLDHWVRAPRRWRELGWALPAVVLGLAVAAAVYRFNLPLLRLMKQDGFVRQQMWLAAGLTVTGIALAGLHCLRPMPRAVPLLLAALLAADLLYANRGMDPVVPRGTFYPRTALTDYLQGLGRPVRVGLSEGGIPAGFFSPYGIEDWVGYDGLYPARMWRFQRTLREDFWNSMEPAAAIAYYLNDPRFPPIMPKEKLKGMELLTTLDGIEVYRNPRSLPRARLVPRAVVMDRKAMFEEMRKADFDPAKNALLESAPKAPLPASDLPPGEARITHFSGNRVTVQADAAAPCVLVLADACYPGWHARIDGVPAELFPVYTVFRGVVLGPGKHTVEFVFNPASFRAGLAVSTLALVLMGAWACLRLARLQPRYSVMSR